jgi:hypothetical protein
MMETKCQPLATDNNQIKPDQARVIPTELYKICRSGSEVANLLFGAPKPL